MSQENFPILAENSIRALVHKLEQAEGAENLSVDLIDGVLHAEFEDGSQIIINSQSSARQLWLASPLGPAHFDYDAASGTWKDERSGEPLEHALERVLSLKLGAPVSLG
ncbi:MAG: iron donor protein CyaY [Pseudomonadota bacterium]